MSTTSIVVALERERAGAYLSAFLPGAPAAGWDTRPLPPLAILLALDVRQVLQAADVSLDRGAVFRELRLRWFAPVYAGERFDVRMGQPLRRATELGTLVQISAELARSGAIRALCEGSVLLPAGTLPPMPNTPRPLPPRSPDFHYVVPEDLPQRYAELSGDHNPVHVSDAFAQSLGFERRILHATCTLSLLQCGILDSVLHGDAAALAALEARFAAPLYPGDALAGFVETRPARGNRRRIAVELVNQHGARVLQAASAELASPPQRARAGEPRHGET